MQTDNILFLVFKEFATLKDNKLQKAYLTTKPKNQLSAKYNLILNKYIVTMESNSTIHLT